VLLGVQVVDLHFWWKAYGPPALKSAAGGARWEAAAVLAALLAGITNLVALGRFGSYRIRWMRFVFLLRSHESLNRLSSNILRSLWQVARVSFMIVFHILIFSIIGVNAFSEIEAKENDNSYDGERPTYFQVQ
jgi:hypothetical protein